MATGRSNSGTLAERWNGRRWRIVPTPNPVSGGGALGSVSCTSPSACTAAGAAIDNFGNEAGTLAERWNGTKWSLQATPNPTVGFETTLDGVACPARRWCTAVGDYGVNATGAERVTLGLQWHGTGHSLHIRPARSQPGSKCAGLPAALSRLPSDLSDTTQALTNPSPVRQLRRLPLCAGTQITAGSWLDRISTAGRSSRWLLQSSKWSRQLRLTPDGPSRVNPLIPLPALDPPSGAC
jgi:hypothetical protein